jgi:CBS domain-containing protein
MADDLSRMEAINESGRGLPVQLSRPGGALPFSPLGRQAYAPTVLARLGWGQGVIAVADVALDDPTGVLPDDSPSVAASRLLDEDSGFVAVLDGVTLVGVVWADALLRGVADGRLPPTVRPLVSLQIPTCAPTSELVDAVRQMMATFLRRIPVVGDAGELIGFLTMASAAQAADRDPAVRDVFESVSLASSLYARRWR